MKNSQRAKSTSQVRINFSSQSSIQKLLNEMKPKGKSTFRISNPHHIHAPRNRCCLIIDVSHGPVWGCAERDVRRMVADACDRAGTAPSFTVENYKRTVLQTRTPAQRRMP